MIAVGFNDGIIKLLDNRYLSTKDNNSRNDNSSTLSPSASPSSPISSRSDNNEHSNNNNELEEENDDDENEEDRERELDRLKVKEESEDELLLNEKKKPSSISNPSSIIVSQLRSGYSSIKELKWSPHKSGFLGVCSDDIVIWNTSVLYLYIIYYLLFIRM